MRYATRFVDSAQNPLEGRRLRIMVLAVPLTEGVSGDEPESDRDAASCGLARDQCPREAPERHRPPATTSGTCERTNAMSRGTAHVPRENDDAHADVARV